LNGKTFVGLSKLRKVFLNENKCINKIFSNAYEVATSSKTIPSNCSLEATPNVNGNTSVNASASLKLIAAVNASVSEVDNEKIRKLETEVLALSDENVKSKAQIGKMNEEIAAMKMKIVKSDAKMKKFGEILSQNLF
jgi:hypothetical protein